MIQSIPAVMRTAQLLDSNFRRARLISQNELVTIIERETGVMELIRAIQSEAARRAMAAGYTSAQWQDFLWPEAQAALNKVYK